MTLVSRELVTVKIESSYNAATTPSATDSVLCDEISWSFTDQKMIERNVIRPSFAKLKNQFVSTLMEISLTCEIKGSGAAYSATVLPELDALFRSCSMSADVVDTAGVETVKYEPESQTLESCTIWVYQDGVGHKVSGCRGDVQFSITASNRIMATFTMKGHVANHADITLIVPAFSSVAPPTVNGQSFAIGGYAAVISSLEFGLNNDIQVGESISSADGYGDINILGRDVSGSFDPLAVSAIATNSFEADWKSAKEMAMTTDYFGDTQYNKFKFTFPNVSYRDMSPGERAGLRTYDMTFGAQELNPYSTTASDLNNEFTLLFD